MKNTLKIITIVLFFSIYLLVWERWAVGRYDQTFNQARHICTESYVIFYDASYVEYVGEENFEWEQSRIWGREGYYVYNCKAYLDTLTDEKNVQCLVCFDWRDRTDVSYSSMVSTFYENAPWQRT